jgi:hypothetical protein
VDDAERQQPGEPLRRAQRGEEAGPAAPVVADQADPRQLEHVEQAEQVAGQLLLVVAAVRGRRRAVPAQVGHHQAVAVLQQRGDRPPAAAVLRPAVQQDERRTGPDLRDVDAQPADVDLPVRGSGHLGLGTGGEQVSGRHSSVRAPAPAPDTPSTRGRARRPERGRGQPR